MKLQEGLGRAQLGGAIVSSSHQNMSQKTENMRSYLKIQFVRKVSANDKRSAREHRSGSRRNQRVPHLKKDETKSGDI